MTATEVVQRTEEKMRLLGPVTGRLQVELLQPCLDRVFAILARQKQFTPAPEGLRDNQIDIEYVSPLAKAQRSGDVSSAMQMVEILMPLMQLDPNIVDYLDTDGLVKHIIKVTGVPAEIVRGEGEIAEIREQKAAAAEQQQQMAGVSQMAEAAGAAAPAMRAATDPAMAESMAGLDEADMESMSELVAEGAA